MKAWTASDRNGDAGFTMVVFAETAGKAKAYAAGTDDFCDYGFTGIRVNRARALDQYYLGEPEMDWYNMDDRIAMVKNANFECSYEIDNPRCEECGATEWCGRYEREHEEG